MQERYLGDIHDYFKFLFLKFLSTQLNMKVGLNWYLVNPAEIGPSELKKKDGEKRKFLHDEELKLYEPIKFNNRKKWLEQSLYHHRDEQIIFLDPDNGFVINKTGKKSMKYVLAEDCKTYLQNNKIIIFCQFQSFRKKTFDHLKYIFKNLNDCNVETSLPVIRNRTGPNTFFISIKPKQVKINLDKILEKYSLQYNKVELINVV